MTYYYSYSPAGQGTGDPDEINVVSVDEDEGTCDNLHCGIDGEHLVVMWTGDEYSRHNAWISAEDSSVIDLEEAR